MIVKIVVSKVVFRFVSVVSCASSNWYDISTYTVFTHSLINVIRVTGGFIQFPVLALI